MEDKTIRASIVYDAISYLRGQCNARETHEALNRLQMMLDTAAVVRDRGRWIDRKNILLKAHPYPDKRQWGFGECSRCGITHNMQGVLHGWRFCPSCGASMTDTQLETVVCQESVV